MAGEQAVARVIGVVQVAANAVSARVATCGRPTRWPCPPRSWTPGPAPIDLPAWRSGTLRVQFCVDGDIASPASELDLLALLADGQGSEPHPRLSGSRPVSRSRGVMASGLMTCSCLRAAT